jgi:hypothetical protein
MSLTNKWPHEKYHPNPYQRIEMFREDGTLVVSLGIGRSYVLPLERIAEIEIGQDLTLASSPLSPMARVLGMSEETLLRCLGLSPRNYLQQVFGFSAEQADSVVDATWELRHQSYLESEKGE